MQIAYLPQAGKVSRRPSGILGSGGSMFLMACTIFFASEGFSSFRCAFSFSLMIESVEIEAVSKDILGL